VETDRQINSSSVDFVKSQFREEFDEKLKKRTMEMEDQKNAFMAIKP